MASTAARMIAVAAAEIGYREGRDANGNWNNATKYGTWYADKIKNAAFRAVAWCDIFISWVAFMSGNGDIIPLNAWVPSRLKYYRDRKATGYFPPKPGDIGILLRNGSPVHVFLVEKWLPEGYVQTIEGNTNTDGSPQGNGVYRLKRRDWSTNPNIIYCRPAYAATAPAPAPAPAPTPKPAPTPAPAPNPYPRGDIRMANLKKGLRNTDVQRLRKAMYEGMSAPNRLTFEGTYDETMANAVEWVYNVWGKDDPHFREAPGEDPWDEPGPDFVKKYGFRPI